MSFEYSRKFVGFVDILGFSALVTDPSKSQKFAKAMYDVLSLFGKSEPNFAFLRHVENDYEMEIEYQWPQAAGAQVSTISDAIVVSVSEYSEDEDPFPGGRIVQILRLLLYVKALQTMLCSIGVLCRGGISLGNFHHSENLAIGEALVAAYRLESEIAIFPRVVIGDEVMSVLMDDDIPDVYFSVRNKIAHSIVIDTDNIPYVNYFGWNDMTNGIFYQSEELARVADEIDKKISIQTNERILEKLEWTQRHLAGCKKAYVREEDLAYTLANEGSQFGDRYFRTWENLAEAVRNAESNGQYRDPKKFFEEHNRSK